MNDTGASTGHLSDPPGNHFIGARGTDDQSGPWRGKSAGAGAIDVGQGNVQQLLINQLGRQSIFATNDVFYGIRPIQCFCKCERLGVVADLVACQ